MYNTYITIKMNKTGKSTYAIQRSGHTAFRVCIAGKISRFFLPAVARGGKYAKLAYPRYARGTDAGDCYASLSRVKRGGTAAYHGYNKVAEPLKTQSREDQAMSPKKKPTSSSPAKKKKQRASKKPRAKAAD